MTWNKLQDTVNLITKRRRNLGINYKNLGRTKSNYLGKGRMKILHNFQRKHN